MSPASPPLSPGALRARLPAALAAVATVAAGLTIRAVAGGWLGEYAGDALYTVLVHTLIVLARPRVLPARAALGALALSWAVEFFQLTPVPAALSAAIPVAGLALGSTFGAGDLCAYAVGAALAGVAHTWAREAPGRPRSARGLRGRAVSCADHA